MYKTDCEKLKEKINEHGLTFQEVSDYLGIDRATFYRRIKRNSLRICDMQKISELLCLTGEEAGRIFLAS